MSLLQAQICGKSPKLKGEAMRWAITFFIGRGVAQ